MCGISATRELAMLGDLVHLKDIRVGGVGGCYVRAWCKIFLFAHGTFANHVFMDLALCNLGTPLNQSN